MMAGCTRLALSLALALAGLNPAAAATVSAVQDGIVAALTVEPAQATVGWRFLTRLEKGAVLGDIVATVNGRGLDTPVIESYPGRGQLTAVIALLDLGDPRRAEQIERFKRAMIVLAAHTQIHDQLAFAVYGLEGNLLAPTQGGPDEFENLLLAMPPLDEGSNLSGALIHAIRDLERLPVSRRAIYVLTDGHNDGSVPMPLVRDLAVATGVTLTFLIAPSERQADLNELAAIATATGGELMREDGIVDFLGDPFALLDSGGRAVFSLEGARRFFWDFGSDEVKIVIEYAGKKELVLATAATLRAGNAAETFAYLSRSPVAHSILGVALFAIGGAVVFLIMRRRNGAPAAAPAEVVTAAAAATAAATATPVSGEVAPAPPPLPPAEPVAPPQTAAAPALSVAPHEPAPSEPSTTHAEPPTTFVAPPPASEPEPLPVLAILHDIGNGADYPIRSVLAHIGRASTNEIILPDQTVSRLHAIVEQGGDGAFSIENRSERNWTLVNHTKISKTPLVEGDLITLGATTLRFSRVIAASRSG